MGPSARSQNWRLSDGLDEALAEGGLGEALKPLGLTLFAPRSVPGTSVERRVFPGCPPERAGEAARREPGRRSRAPACPASRIDPGRKISETCPARSSVRRPPDRTRSVVRTRRTRCRFERPCPRKAAAEWCAGSVRNTRPRGSRSRRSWRRGEACLVMAADMRVSSINCSKLNAKQLVA